MVYFINRYIETETGKINSQLPDYYPLKLINDVEDSQVFACRGYFELIFHPSG